MASQNVNQGQNIQIDVEFYNAAEEAKFAHYSNAAQIKLVAGQSIVVPTAEFLTYYLFGLRNPGCHGYRSYTQIGRKVDKAIADLEDLIVFNGCSIAKDPNGPDIRNSVREAVGEGVGLAVANRINGLTRADWGKISHTSKYPIFDYQLATNGTLFVQVETKGSVVDDNSEKPSAVSKQKSKIDKKKAKISALQAAGNYPYPNCMRFGTIGVLDSRPNSMARVWLVDPPSDEVPIEPRTFRLLVRMRYIRDLISFVAPRSSLAIALSTRLRALETLEDPFELDGVPLLDGMGWKISPDNWLSTGPRGAVQSRVADSPAGGKILNLGERGLLFLGVRDNLWELAAEQNFGAVLEYSSHTRSVENTIDCVLSVKKFSAYRLPEDLAKPSNENSNHRRFKLNGMMHYNDSGMVFGALPVG